MCYAAPMLAASSHGLFRFFAGHPALDLPATLTGRLKAQQRELLGSPDDLGRWLVQSGVAEKAPRMTHTDLTLARELRESIYAAVLSRVAGKPLPTAVRTALNRIALGRSSVPQLDARGRVRVTASARASLVDLARDAIRLLGSDAAERLRQCDAETCARLFIDTSRAGDRRWCSMSGCGNKAKVAEFRRRQRAGD